MKLTCVGSGSSGNCYVLSNNEEALILDCGVPYNNNVKRAIDWNIRKLMGVVVTHEHGDHARYVDDYKKLYIPVYQPYLEDTETTLTIGNWYIRPFELKHDVECRGFYIKHPDIGKLLYITDTEYVPQIFKNVKVNHFLVEANFDADNVDFDDDKEVYKNHVYLGHMAIQTTVDFLKKNVTEETKNVILCHLSSTNSDEQKFLEMASEVTDAPIYIARQGLTIEL